MVLNVCSTSGSMIFANTRVQVQIESQAVETACMLEKFEGSVAALREIERQYGQLQVLPSLTLCPNTLFACFGRYLLNARWHQTQKESRSHGCT